MDERRIVASMPAMRSRLRENAMSNCLPEGYDKIPSTGRYMKLQEGENVLRILSSAIVGWVYWNTSGKPVRLRERPAARPMDIRTEPDGKESIKHFWAFAVWNYAEKMVQVLEVTQVQIQGGIKALVDSKHWGDPKNYDITINRSGSGFDTEYIVNGIPPKPLDQKIAEEYAKSPVNLSALYESGDPFAGKPSSAEAVDGPGFQEPAIEMSGDTEPPTPDRYKSVPPEFRP
jgi:hypothetical protein